MCKSGSILHTAARPGCVHICGTASGVSSPQASEVGVPVLPGYSALGGFLSSMIWTHLLLYSCVVHVRFGSSRRWNFVWSLVKGSVVYWQGICQSYTFSRSGCTSHRTFPVPVSSWSQRCKQTPDKTSQSQVVECSFLPTGSFFLPSLKLLAAETLAISMEVPMGNARDAAEERRIRRKGECQGPGASTDTVELAAKEATVGEYLGLLCYPRSSDEPVPEQASSVSRCAGAGHSFFSSLHSSDTGRACVVCF